MNSTEARSRVTRGRRSERGLTLIEALVAITVFAVVFIAALMLYSTASSAYLRTDSSVIQQQNVRFSMDRMAESLRDAGAGHNMLGSKKLADEQIEGVWESAVFVRGDYDGLRETSLENSTFPIVTTGNDELVGYVLRKAPTPTNPNPNNINLSVKADLTGTGRDAVWTSNTQITREETVNVAVAATTVAQQTSPPYQLVKVTFNAAGTPQYEVLAENINQLKFEYFTADGATAMTTGINSSADNERDERATIRKVVVRLTGQSDRRDMAYAGGTGFRTFPLEQVIIPANLGIVGNQHNAMPPLDLPAPAYVTACTGHCRSYIIRWPASSTPGITQYSVKITAAAATGTNGSVGPFSTEATASSTSLQLEWKQPQIDIDAGVFRQFSFAVAPKAGSSVGTYTPAVQLVAENRTPQSTPEVPQNVAATGASGEYAMQVTWDPVTTNTGAVTSGGLCASAGSGSAGSQPPGPWNQTAVDLDNAKVFRVRSTGSNNGSAAGVDISNATLLTLKNIPSQGPFTDRTAAPCSAYFYRVQACDLCDVESSDSAPMATAASFTVPAGVVPGKPTGVTSAASVASSGGNFVFDLTWDPVVTTKTGDPAGTAVYRIWRATRVGTGTYGSATKVTDVYEALTYPQAVPQLDGTGQDIDYRYWVQAIYSCSTERESDLSDPFDVTCAAPAAAAAAISVAGGEDFARPAETTVPLVIGVSGATYTGAQVWIENSAGTTVHGPLSLTGPPSSGTYTFTAWNAAEVADGTYTIYARATVTGGCIVVAAPVSFTVSTTACGQRMLQAAFQGTGNNFATSMTFKMENACPAAMTINSLTPTWTGVAANVRLTGISSTLGTHYSNNTGVLSGTAIPLTLNIVLPTASGTTPSQTAFTFTFNDNFTIDATRDGATGQFTSVQVNISAPTTKTGEELVDGGNIP